MTAPAPETTPTRDEAVRDRIAGPHVAVPLKIVERIRAYRASQPYDPVLSQIEIDMNIALAPAPASGGVDAVKALEPFAKAIIPDSDTICGWRFGTTPKHEDFVRAHEVYAAPLSPAATPVSEAEPVAAVVAEELALKIVSLSVNWLREDGTDREHENYVRANWTKEIAEAKRLILAALSPAATPVSEAGGAALALDSEMRNAEFETWARKNGCHLHLHEGGEDRRYGYDLTERAWLGWCAALAKPAPSPAPVRPIGNQGISDYQREIARNMAEGFAAWNAARQETLPSDEPASSPAGGDVRDGALGWNSPEEWEIEQRAFHAAGRDDVPKDVQELVAILWKQYCIAAEPRAALSQSTSAGRVGE